MQLRSVHCMEEKEPTTDSGFLDIYLARIAKAALSGAFCMQ